MIANGRVVILLLLIVPIAVDGWLSPQAHGRRPNGGKRPIGGRRPTGGRPPMDIHPIGPHAGKKPSIVNYIILKTCCVYHIYT